MGFELRVEPGRERQRPRYMGGHKRHLVPFAEGPLLYFIRISHWSGQDKGLQVLKFASTLRQRRPPCLLTSSPARSSLSRVSIRRRC
jgi:hypothetical protein